MKHIRKAGCVSLRFSLSAVMYLIMAVSMQATVTNTITSANFSLGYSFIGPNVATPVPWSTVETFAVNTPTTQGDFTFLPTVSSRSFGGAGPDFPNRVLSDGTFFQVTGDSINWTNTVTAAWTGVTPPDAAPNPNYQIQLNITSLRIWGIAFAGFEGNKLLAFSEATPGHADTSSSITLIATNNAGLLQAVNYTQLVWDPTDYQTNGTSFTRSFVLVSSTDQGLDGFEVFGNVALSYEAIPEPSSLMLGLSVLGGWALSRMRWK